MGELVEESSRSGRLAHRPDLDGLRGLAIMFVLVEHTGLSSTGYLFPFTPAMVGVTVFFVMSGFLITTLLASEIRIDLRNFYLRRALRLGPALVVLLVVVIGLGLTRVDPWPWLPGVISSVLYVTNWTNILGIPSGILQHTWSLAIEEQFYLAWPIAMVLLPRKMLLPISVGLATAGCATYALGIGPVFYSTFTNGGAIMAGCAAALFGRRLPRVAGLLGLALVIVSAAMWSQAGGVVGAVLLVLAPIEALLPLANVGRRAYSLYLWNLPLAVLVGGPAALPLTFIAGELSYRIVERPIRRRFHSRLRSRSSSAPAALADATGR